MKVWGLYSAKASCLRENAGIFYKDAHKRNASPMTDRDLIDELGKLLRRPLQEISEAQFKRHGQAQYERGGDNRIDRDAYCLAKDGSVSGLFLQPVTSELLIDFPFQQLEQLKYLFLSRVKLRSYAFLRNLTGLTSLDLSTNRISDASFLRNLTGLAALDLRNNRIAEIPKWLAEGRMKIDIED